MTTSPRPQFLLGGLSSTGTLSGVTTGTSRPFKASDVEGITFYFQTIGSPGAGTVIVEEASWNDFPGPLQESQYTGTWSTINTIAYTTIGNNSQVAYHLTTTTPYHYIRVRVGTTFTSAELVVRMVTR